MEIKTFRAKTMPQALDLVRRELGAEAMVLHTRELNAGLVRRMLWGRAYEIAATGNPPPSKVEEGPRRRGGRGGTTEVEFEFGVAAGHNAGSLSEQPVPSTEYSLLATYDSARSPQASARGFDSSATSLSALRSPLPAAPFDDRLAELQSLVEQLRARAADSPQRDMPPALFDVFTDLIEADVDEEVARELIDRLRREPSTNRRDPVAARIRLAHMLQSELQVTGPIPVTPGAGRTVALVGPTGVGKTTTIAKLAANFRLRENRRVGLITVDTYRIAAVEQLRTYADIIDLPMEVVSTPREMREAAARMRDFDLVLMDTAGRSPRDEVRIRELRAMLAEAPPDEVHLVLSAAASARSLTAAAEKFAPVGVTSLIVTKLDEATGLGNLVTLARDCGLPFSYLTDGQNVPDDIAVAAPKKLAELILNVHAAV